MHRLKFILIFVFFAQSYFLFSQVGNSKLDSLNKLPYFSELNNQFILRFFGLYKSNNVDLSDNNNTLKYRPNGVFNVGVGFNYKFLGLGISYGAPVTAKSKDKYGNTQRLDVQASIFSKAFGLDGFLQIYQGYYISNPGDFLNWNDDKFPQIPDMRVLTLALNAFYIVNNNRFSYRAAFVGNQIQNKSAGSITAGLFGTYDQVITDNGFVPKDISDSLNKEFDLKSFDAYTIGLSAGYMYTFVFGKGFFLSLAAVPGIGYRHYKTVQLSDSINEKSQIAFQLIGRIALGYSRSRYFINLNTIFNWRNYNYNSYDLSLSTEQLRLTVGIRFETKASKKRNQFYPQ